MPLMRDADVTGPGTHAVAPRHQRKVKMEKMEIRVMVAHRLKEETRNHDNVDSDEEVIVKAVVVVVVSVAEVIQAEEEEDMEVQEVDLNQDEIVQFDVMEVQHLKVMVQLANLKMNAKEMETDVHHVVEDSDDSEERVVDKGVQIKVVHHVAVMFKTVRLMKEMVMQHNKQCAVVDASIVDQDQAIAKAIKEKRMMLVSQFKTQRPKALHKFAPVFLVNSKMKF